jgi:two-component system cell cycle sensor histidine kinase/response regulator CckA
MEIWTLWHADYLASAAVKAITAVVSLGTAGMLVRAMPQVLALPSPQQLREAHEQLRIANERLQDRVRLAQATGLGFWERDPVTGQTHLSPEWAAELGYAPGEIESGDDAWEALVHPEDRERLQATLGEAVAAGSQSFEIEARVRRRDGAYRDILTRAGVTPGPSGEPLLRGACLDITDRKRTEEALRRAAKDESLSVLAGGVAHDFNNLLVAMLGHSSLALAKLPPESPARASIEKIVQAAERAADLTRQMLAYSGKGHFEVRPLDLNRLIGENLHLFAAGLPKLVHLVPQLEDDIPRVKADIGQIQQVVMNLVLNAAEAIGDQGGQVTVRTGVQTLSEDDGHYSHLTRVPLQPGTYALLEVQDDGRGMDALTLARIFDPFFTTKFTGRGLGLAAVLGIVRGHGGGISVASEPGRGTTFKLLFPACGAEPTEPVSTPAGEPRAWGFVLVIDDEAMVRDAVLPMLESQGFQVLMAPSGAEGVEVYRAYRHHVRLVLLDLSMPGPGGLETFKLLRDLDPSVRVILSSGYNEVEATRTFAGKGLAGFLQKPYDVATLGTCLRRTLAMTS